uniref:FLYWCH-type domain-containing protein n=1 Tax=Meloidogyne hapla TaxID=6305 RepID=A0A1I8B5D1_MELHA
MDIRAKLIEIQKSRKRRLPINDSSKLSEVHQPGTNLEEDTDENSEANLIKFEQGVTNKGNVVALWHAGYRYVKNDKNSNYWRCSNKDCPAKAKQEGGQFIGILGKKEHNHPPVIQKKTAEEIRNKLKREARGNILAEAVWECELYRHEQDGYSRTYIDGLRYTERQPEERDTEDGMDNENSESDQPGTSSSLFI